MAGEVCGALSGAVLAIGLLYGEEQPEGASHLTEQFMSRYAEQHEAVRCIDIVGFNVSSISTKVEIADAKQLLSWLARGGKRACNKVVRNAIEVLLETLNEWES